MTLGQALLGGRPGLPLCQQRINARGDRVQDGVTPRRAFHSAWGRHLQVFIDGRATETQVTGHLLDADAFDQDFMTDDMNSLHAEHSFPPVAEILAQPYWT
jgi:hypothetical protein